MTNKEPSEVGLFLSEPVGLLANDITPPLHPHFGRFSQAMEIALEAVENMQENKTH